MRFTNQFKEYKLLLLFFLIWRVFLQIPIIVAPYFFSLQNNYLGGGMKNYLHSTYLWAWVNFDGEHYLSIARYGYRALTYFFFPVYPLTISFIAKFIGDNEAVFLYSGLFISNISFCFALIGLWKLLKLDYKKQVVLKVIALLLLFPTSFYFVSYYTESLFLAFVVWSFYFARKGKWYMAGLFALVASATRVIGIIMLPSLLFEFYLQNKQGSKLIIKPSILYIFLAPLGLLFYMLYLNIKTGDPLIFLHSIGVFGEQRSTSLIFLPQVFYRYIFKILPNISYSYWPQVYTTWMEFILGLLFSLLAIYSLIKLRLSYAVFLIAGLLLSTFSGSFSSLPRYVLVLFPGFILLGILIDRLPKLMQAISFILLFSLLFFSFEMFSRGFWIS